MTPRKIPASTQMRRTSRTRFARSRAATRCVVTTATPFHFCNPKRIVSLKAPRISSPLARSSHVSRRPATDGTPRGQGPARVPGVIVEAGLAFPCRYRRKRPLARAWLPTDATGVVSARQRTQWRECSEPSACSFDLLSTLICRALERTTVPSACSWDTIRETVSRVKPR
jgi:hypothetical protein